MTEATPPLRHIVAATDLSPAAEIAVQRAAHLAAASGAALTLLSVLPVSVWKDTLAIVADLYLHGPTPHDPHKAEAETQAKLEAMAAQLAAEHGIACHTRLASGRPAAEIAACATEMNADLVVVGAHGAYRVHELLLGTTTQKLARTAACPVLVVRKPPPFDYATVLAPTDLSPPSARAAALAARLLPQATLHLAHAWQLPYEGLLRYAATDPAAVETYRAQADARLRAALEAFIDTAGLDRRRVVPHVRHAYAPRAIDDWIRTLRADLVVVAAGGKSDLSIAFLGSVSLHVLHSAPCDVLLVRGG